jgi:N-methylhydantoinase B
MSESRWDPVSLEVIWNRLIAVADEAAVTLVRSAFSPIVRESNDFSCVLFDSQGRAVAENTLGIPSFNAVIARTMKHFLRLFPAETWQPGDVGITNDPWLGSGHLPDVTIVAPVYRDGRLVAWTGSVAHKSDIGGAVWSADTHELYEEGFRIPPMKLFEAGRPNDVLLELLQANVRLPEEVVGDIMAQVGAGEVAGRRLLEVLEDHGLHTLDPLAEAIQRRAEEVMRTAIRLLPDGVYRDSLETDGVDGEPIRLAVAITVRDDEMTVDYSGSSPQIRWGLNNTLTYTDAYTCYPIKCLLDPTTPRNEGSYRPIHVQAPLGSILNPTFPAPVHARQLVGHYLAAVIYGALAPILPDRVIADSGSTPNLRCLVSGQDAEARKFTAIFFLNGGMGARADQDGLSCASFPSNTTAGSMEVIEAGAPVRVWRRELRCDSGGPGRFRGGLGQELEIELTAPYPATLSLFVDRVHHPARGLFGGLAGAPSAVALNGRTEGLVLKGRSLLKPGDRLVIRYPGGGGYGPPGERAREAVRDDLENERISEAAARTVYQLEDAG